MRINPNFYPNDEVYCWNHNAPNCPRRCVIETSEIRPAGREDEAGFDYKIKGSDILEPDQNVISVKAYNRAQYILETCYSEAHSSLAVRNTALFLFEVARGIDNVVAPYRAITEKAKEVYDNRNKEEVFPEMTELGKILNNL